MFELIEIDPVTGEEDHLISTGTMRAMEKDLKGLLEDIAEDWDENDQPWSWYRIQPAT